MSLYLYPSGGIFQVELKASICNWTNAWCALTTFNGHAPLLVQRFAILLSLVLTSSFLSHIISQSHSTFLCTSLSCLCFQLNCHHFTITRLQTCFKTDLQKTYFSFIIQNNVFLGVHVSIFPLKF